MARFNRLTTKQIQVLDPLKEEATFYKKKYEEINVKLSNRLINCDFDENQRLRKLARDFKRKYEDKQAEINNILNAREEYDYCISKAQSLCKRAESLKKTWGFE